MLAKLFILVISLLYVVPYHEILWEGCPAAKACVKEGATSHPLFMFWDRGVEKMRLEDWVKIW